MRHLMTVVEQLDRAANELSTDHPINNRLALILVDNTVELIVHRRCMDRLSLHLAAAQLTPKEREMARSRFFSDKLKMIEALGDINRTEKQFIKTAHKYRNELFHVGLRYDDIVRPISGNYFLLCCDLFARLKPGYRVHIPSDKYTEISKRYLSEFGSRFDFMNVEVEVLARSLRNLFPTGIPELSKTLARSARKSIEEVEEDLGFLIENNLEDEESTEVIRAAQWRADFKEALRNAGHGDSEADQQFSERVTQFRKKFEVDWRPKFNSFPKRSWIKRSRAIEFQSDPLQALVMYEQLRNHMAYFEGAIQSYACELDRWIQIQIDRSLGK